MGKLQTQGKHANAKVVTNYMKLGATSNHLDCVPLGRLTVSCFVELFPALLIEFRFCCYFIGNGHGRRYAICDVMPTYCGVGPDAQAQSRPYFSQLLEQMSSPSGLAAFFHHLLRVDISGFDPRVLPPRCVENLWRLANKMDAVEKKWLVLLCARYLTRVASFRPLAFVLMV